MDGGSIVRTLRVADLFCGAGGLSEGARKAAESRGFEIDGVAINHWPVAVATHRKNHPNTRHYCAAVESVRPREAVPEGSLDVLLAAPSCVHHSRARGGRPTSDQQRADPWHILPWLAELEVKHLLVENVQEIMKWGPVDPVSGKPIKEREGEYFNVWIAAIRAFMPHLQFRIVRCADYGDPTTRDRFLMIASKHRPVPWPAATHAHRSKAEALELQPWVPARDIIDWGFKGRSIYGRKKPLALATLRRIEAGMMRFGWPQPFLVVLRNHMSAVHLDEPVPTIGADGNHIALVEPFMLSQASGGAPRSVGEPVPTIPTDGAHALIAPYYGSGSGETCSSSEDPLPTVTTKARFAMITPVTHSGSVDDPLPTITGAHRGELAFITAAFGERPTQAPRTHDIDDPVPTICAEGRIPLAEAGRDYDVLFRMLQPHELAAATSLERFEFTGNKEEQTKQIGNAVPACTGAAHVGALIDAL